MIHFGKISHLSATGKRKNNEDSFRIGKNGVFLVCDGVGGVEKGEVASEIVADTFLRVYTENPDSDPHKVLREAERALSAHIGKHPDSSGMATTLTFSQLRNDGIMVAWVGDSRVYQFRKGQLVYKTNDHSWVNEAVQAGILTPEEAINHPKSNVITRAVQGEHNPTSLDQVFLTDIQPGDYIMHCSDGVLESWDDEDLSALFNSSDDVDELMSHLALECEKDSRDNYTAIIYNIDDVSISKSHEPSSESIRKHSDSGPIEVSYQNDVKVKETKSWMERWFWNMKIPLTVLIVILLFASLIYKIYSGGHSQFGPFSKDSIHTIGPRLQRQEVNKVLPADSNPDSSDTKNQIQTGTNRSKADPSSTDYSKKDTERKIQ